MEVGDHGQGKLLPAFPHLLTARAAVFTWLAHPLATAHTEPSKGEVSDHDASTDGHRQHLRRGGEISTTFLAVAAPSCEPNDRDLSLLSKHSSVTVGVSLDEAVR